MWKSFSDFILALVSGILGFSIAMTLFLPDANLKDALEIIGAGLGASLTVLGAFAISVYQLRKQENVENAKREQNLRAAKAVLVNDLSQFCTYLDACSSSINQVAAAISRGQANPPVNIPNFPEESLFRFERIIALADEESAQALINFMEVAQVHRARFEDEMRHITGVGAGVVRRAVRVDNLEMAVIGTIGLYALAEHLFQYARRECSVVNTLVVTEEGIRNTIRVLGLNTDLMAGVVTPIAEMFVRRCRIEV